MNVEFEVRMILRKEIGIRKKAEIICKLMTWDWEILIDALKKYGTHTTWNRSEIVRTFWGKQVSK